MTNKPEMKPFVPSLTPVEAPAEVAPGLPDPVELPDPGHDPIFDPETLSLGASWTDVTEGYAASPGGPAVARTGGGDDGGGDDDEAACYEALVALYEAAAVWRDARRVALSINSTADDAALEAVALYDLFAAMNEVGEYFDLEDVVVEDDGSVL